MPSRGAIRRWALRLASLLRFGRAEADLSRKIGAHLHFLEEQFGKQGLSPDEARLAAKRAFGGVDQAKEQHRDARSFRWLVSWWPDLKLGGRMLLRYPGLTLVGGAAMAFGIAVGTAGFEVLSQIVSPRLPFDDAERIVAIRLWDTAANRAETRALYDFAGWREQLKSVEDLGAFTDLERNLITADGRSEPLHVAEISASAFRVAPVSPLFGRPLVEADEHSGAPQVLVIGYDVWQTRFGGTADVIGRNVRLGDVPAVVVGVMPEGFAFPINHEAWTPLRRDRLAYSPRTGPAIVVFGHLTGDVSVEEARNELTSIGLRTASDFRESHEHLRPEVMPYAESIASVRGAASLALMSINVFLTLLVVLASSNVALLMFARAATREGEIAVRSALGASRGRIITQLLAEALVLGGVSVVVGLAAARLLLQWWLRVSAIDAAGRLPFWFTDQMTLTTVLYACGLTVLSAVVAGVVPALKATTRRLEPQLRQVGARATLRIGGIWTAVIVTQVAITVTFPAATFFVQRNVAQKQSLDVGFPAAEYLSARLEMDAEGTRGDLARAWEELERRLSSQPDVAGVTFTDRLPRTVHSQDWIEIDGVDATGPTTARVNVASVSANYFAVLDAPMLSGRAFQPADRAPDARSVIVNADFVRIVLGGRNPVGRRVRDLPGNPNRPIPPGHPPGPWSEIVGVARTLGTIHDDPRELTGLYRPLQLERAHSVHIAVHVKGEPAAFAPRLRTLAASVDSTLRLYDVQRLDAVGASMWNEFDFLFRLLMLASGIALLLSLAGIYAVMSFAVSRQTREIGIRVALGASARRVIASTFARPLTQVACGIGAGSVLVAIVSILVLDGLSAREMVLVAGYSLAMTAVCLLACIVPTQLALRIEPTDALKAE